MRSTFRGTLLRSAFCGTFLRSAACGFRFCVFLIFCFVSKRLAFLKKLDFSKNWILLKSEITDTQDVELELGAGRPKF